jgi:hypothetical protein
VSNNELTNDYDCSQTATFAERDKETLMSTTPDLSKEFVGRRALITGGTKGIGAAIAQRLLDGGGTVAVASRSQSDTTPHGALFIAGDAWTVPGTTAIGEEAVNKLGGLDILINIRRRSAR